MAANPPQYFARAIHTSTEIIHAWLEFRPVRALIGNVLSSLFCSNLQTLTQQFLLKFIQCDLMKNTFSSTRGQNINSIMPSL